MAENIYLFVPNIIDYCRVICAFIAFYFMRTDYIKTVVIYLFSILLDDFDGRAARKLNQGSRLGSVIDTITDRVSNMGMCSALCYFYPEYMFWLQAGMVLDIFSHWLFVHSTALQGLTSHKHTKCSFALLHLYYNVDDFLSVVNAANEICFSMIYLQHFTPGPILTVGGLSVGLFKAVMILCAPLALLKAFINVQQLICAAQNIVHMDQQERARAAANKAE